MPRCGQSLHLYALFITDQYQEKYWAGYIGRYMLLLQDKSSNLAVHRNPCRASASDRIVVLCIVLPCRASASDRIVVLCTRCLFVIIMLLLDTIAFIYQKACCIRAVQTFTYIGDLLLIKKK